MAKSKFPTEIRVLVETRADGRCEYCMAADLFAPHPFSIDHIIPLSAGGSDSIDNLAYGCNRCKHGKTTAIDPFSQTSAPIFNPRTQAWENHFTWDSTFAKVLGLTTTGRASVTAIQLNRPTLLRMRKELIEVNRHPPT